MNNRIKKVKRKIMFLEKQREEYNKRISELLYPFGILRILKRDIRREVVNLKELSGLLEIELKDLYRELNSLEKKTKI